MICKFENCVRDKKTFLIKWNIAFPFQAKTYFILGDMLFKILKNLIASTFFFGEADTKYIDMPRQKPRMLHW